MKGDLFIKVDGNEVDAYENYGMSLEPSGISQLMTPPPMKDFVSNSSRLQHGERVVNNNPKYNSRDLTIPFHIVASSPSDFLNKYHRLCTEILAKGSFEIRTRYEPGVIYRLNYISCSQFTEFRMEMAFFSLKLNEPDPSNRE